MPAVCLQSAAQRSVLALQCVASDEVNEAGYATVRSRGYIELQASTALLSTVCDVDVIKASLAGKREDSDVLAAAETALLAFVNAEVSSCFNQHTHEDCHRLLTFIFRWMIPCMFHDNVLY